VVAKQKGQLDPLKKALSFLAPQSFRVLKYSVTQVCAKKIEKKY